MNLDGHATVVVAIFIIIMGAIFLQYSTQAPFSWYPVGGNQIVLNASQSAQITSQFCTAPTAGDVITFSGPQDNATKCPDGPSGSYKSGGTADNDFGGGTTYKLVRKNVPLNKSFFSETVHSIKASEAGINPGLDTSKYELYFPKISGEVKIEGGSPYSRTRDCGDRSYESQGLVYFIDYGLAFGMVLKDGQPIDVGGFYLVDVFKDTKREQEVPAEAWALCSSPATPSSSPVPVAQNNIVIPQNESPDNAQLQLSWFLFSGGSRPSAPPGAVVNGWYDTCKPAVYLYPPMKLFVNVKVDPDGFLTYTDPIYDSNYGWNVEANPDGMIFTKSGGKYGYLYFESKVRDEVIRKPNEGWVIQSKVTNATEETKDWYDPLERHFNEILPKLGLNAIQTRDFIDYWKKALPYSPYYFIGIVDQQNVNQFERLEITPKPDFVNRVRIYFERLDQPRQVQPPVLPSTNPDLIGANYLPLATNFNVIEWGGMVKNDPNHPFTCSQ